MFAWLTRKLDRRRNARELYGSIVTQARDPAFYAAIGIPDSVQGRFEMVLLHVSLVMDRLQREGESGQALARALGEAFIADMDANMREMTFGDLAVPREIKRAAAALFDRHTAYQAEIKAGREELLERTLAGQLGYLLPAGGQMDVRALAHYMFRVTDGLAGQAGPELLAGRAAWPRPGAAGGPLQKG